MTPGFPMGFYAAAVYRYLADPPRQRRYTDKQMKRYQDHALRRMVRLAYETPFYHRHFDVAGIRPEDIRGVDDLSKLPLTSKNDVRSFLTLRPTSSQENVASTQGTTGVPVTLPLDSETILRSMLGFIRILREHGVDWQRTRIALLLDVTANSFENGYFLTSLFPRIKFLAPLKNIRVYDLQSPPDELLEGIKVFRPQAVFGYPFTLLRLADLNEQGSNVTIDLVGSSGAYLDSYVRRRLKAAFGSRVVDIYAATEMGPIAFECAEGQYHLLSDLVLAEDSGSGTDGPRPIVVTKLYGKGLPLIRYTGIDDIVTFTTDSCSCGLTGGYLKGIHGRHSEALPLPDGTRACVSFLDSIIGRTLTQTPGIHLQRMQITQHSLTRIEITVKFNATTKPQQSDFCTRLEHELHKALGAQVDVAVTETTTIDQDAPYLVIPPSLQQSETKQYRI